MAPSRRDTMSSRVHLPRPSRDTVSCPVDGRSPPSGQSSLRSVEALKTTARSRRWHRSLHLVKGRLVGRFAVFDGVVVERPASLLGPRRIGERIESLHGGGIVRDGRPASRQEGPARASSDVTCHLVSPIDRRSVPCDCVAVRLTLACALLTFLPWMFACARPP